MPTTQPPSFDVWFNRSYPGEASPEKREGARAAWNAVIRATPTRCPNCGTVPTKPTWEAPKLAEGPSENEA
jgi:hypothetical protein